MTKHLTARIAWHDDGWNGHVCKKPECNTYCAGKYSYPGDVIATERNLKNEKQNAGKHLSEILDVQDIPPCVYSANAFGEKAITGYSKPPRFFNNEAKPLEWDIPQSTVCVWPYEAVYGDDVYDEKGHYDNDKRDAKVNKFFEPIGKQIKDDESTLIFYYANYSNPFSKEEDLRYVLVGVSRVKEIGEKLKYPDASDKIKNRYADGIVWARNITSFYPDEGFRLPYHLYRDESQIEELQSFAVFPDNPNDFKYGSKQLSNDIAIGLLEKFLYSIEVLKEIGDKSENWDERKEWIERRIAELWKKRGLYPGLLNVMELFGVPEAIPPAKKMIESGESQKAYNLFFSAITEKQDVAEFGLMGKPLEKLSRRWQLQDDNIQIILKDIIPRFGLSMEQIKHIASDNEKTLLEHKLDTDISAIIENPYIISENYVGKDPDDIIPWGVIDRGVIPSPELGGDSLAEIDKDDPKRFRSICVETLRNQRHQTFESAESVLEKVNTRISKFPEWKKPSYDFTGKNFEIDKAIIEKAITMRKEKDRLWLYLKHVYENERCIEENLTKLANRTDIPFNKPFSHDKWCDQLRETNSALMKEDSEEYEKVINNQAEECQKIFQKPLSIITGAAGTGKTSVICAMINAIKAAEGTGTPLTILAPTGKAADRIRDKISSKGLQGIDNPTTVHSFIASNGWLNKNLTYREKGGNKGGDGTVIIDEASMIELDLMATLVRAIDWQQIKRLILVGDPNQLPPIGRGRVFYDTIQWLKGSEARKESIAHLTENLRQKQNDMQGEGTAIVELSKIFTGDGSMSKNEDGEQTSLEAEELIARLHSEEEVDNDLKVVYWQKPEEIGDLLINMIEKEMMEHVQGFVVGEAPYNLWKMAFADEKDEYRSRPEKYQVLTPYRGEMYGVEAINEKIQKRIKEGMMKIYGSVDGITISDKVIQYRNRTKSNPITAYNFNSHKSEEIEVFNGEIGFVKLYGRDSSEKKKTRYNITRFSVEFERKKGIAVGYGKNLLTSRGKKKREKVEDNLELAYAISVHKAQGSEFEHTYFIIPKTGHLMSRELIYTALTRASRHCTLLIQGDVRALLAGRRRENSQIALTNSSLFSENFYAVPDELINLKKQEWYEEGKIHKSLSQDMVRSKSELIIANALHDKDITFYYEKMLKADDGSIYLPDFTIKWQGEEWYWEHWGMVGEKSYDEKRERKVEWYKKNFPERLIETFEGKNFSEEVQKIIGRYFTE